jgi:uroporphyrinogen-III synthase/uncharacterized protein HemX
VNSSFQVLVTRPSPQGEALCAELKKHGFGPVFMPVMQIEPLVNEALTQRVYCLTEYAAIIFLSRHAVAIGAPILKEIWPKTASVTKIIAVGEGTADALKQAGFSSVIYPPRWSTEGLLALPELQMVKDKKIALMTGKSGRETLAQELAKRGAQVDTLMLYQRVLPAINTKPYDQLLAKQKIQAVICTSVQGVLFLKKLFSASVSWEKLRKIPLVLVSERIKIQAQEQGFEACYIARDASHDSILQALQKIRSLSMSGTNKSNDHSVAVTPSASSGRARKRLAWMLVIILIVAAITLGFFSLNQFAQQSLLKVAQQLQTDQKQILLLNNQLIELQQKLQTQESILQQQGRALSNELMAKNHSNLLIAQRWVELGQQYFMLTADIPRTINFLSQAQNELDKITDLQIIPVKQALAQDVATLKNLPWIDPAELYLQLVALQKEITQLPILLVPVQDSAPVKFSNLAETESAWKRGLYNAWQTLRQMVVVHHLPTPNAPPFILPDQHPYIYQNLYNLLDQAIWAVMHQDANVYYSSLNQAIQWINQYFLLSSFQTKTALEELAKLRTVSVQPAKGILLTAPKAFHDYVGKNK